MSDHSQGHLAAAHAGRVLVVDDEEPLVRAVGRMLTASGHIVKTATDGRQAAELLSAEAFDTIVSDIDMPRLNGIQLLQIVRQRDLDVPVVLMTGNPNLKTAVQAVAHGALQYLTKPVNLEELGKVVRRAIRLNRMAKLKRDALVLVNGGGLGMVDRAALELTFDRALETTWMAYQPIARAAERTLFGYEAVLHSEERTLSGRAALIDAAERLGRLDDLGRKCRAAVSVVISQASPSSVFFLSVHISELLDAFLLSSKSPLSAFAERVVLEVTERASLDQLTDVRATVAALRRMGFRIAIDDLGAGSAGLTSFATLEPEFVKLDTLLIRDVDRHDTKEKLVRSMTALSKELGMMVVAKGIETAKERETLVALGCDLLQGDLLAKPGRSLPDWSGDVRNREGSMQKKQADGEMTHEESGARYRGLLEAAPDAMVVVNQGGEIVLLNLQAEKQFGYHRDELLGQKVKNIIPEGFAERLVADGLRSAADALAQQIGTGIELTARRKDGSEFPIEIMLSPLESAEGVLVTAAIRDITVRRAAERHLAQMEGRYRGLLEAAPDAMVVVNTGGAIVLLNVQAENQFGYHRDELLGQKVKNIIPEGFAERLVADGLRSAADALAQQIGTGIELIARRKDGSEFPIEIMLSPLESAEGILVTAAIRDITVRKAAERHLAQMEGRYRGLLEAAPDAMVVVDQQGAIVLLNAQAETRFGYHRDELLGQQVKAIIPEGFAERLLADGLRSAADALAQQIGTGIELTGRRKDGTEFPIELMLSPLQSAGGTLVTAAIRDITTRKRAEEILLQKVEELNRSNQELAQFAYVASHDLQEPLRLVASYTQLLSRRYKGKLDADADEFITYAVDGATRMQRLIQDLLTYSRVGTKGRELRDASSEEAFDRAMMNLRVAIEDSGALVTHDPLPVVLADETQLVQLFQNLVGNAIKYHDQGAPRVHVSAVKNGGKKWTFSVADNGLGIDSKYFEKIFGMFQRLHGREQFAGTGIGLAICKKIVERHGGHISVESEVGHGSTFSFALTGSEIS